MRVPVLAAFRDGKFGQHGFAHEKQSGNIVGDGVSASREQNMIWPVEAAENLITAQLFIQPHGRPE
jgi:hypothetical protein